MCLTVIELICPGCAGHTGPTLYPCFAANMPFHSVMYLSLSDLLRNGSYNCPNAGCSLNQNIHHMLNSVQTTAIAKMESFTQQGFELAADALSSNQDNADEPCELALSDHEKVLEAASVPKDTKSQASV